MTFRPELDAHESRSMASFSFLVPLGPAAALVRDATLGFRSAVLLLVNGVPVPSVVVVAE